MLFWHQLGTNALVKARSAISYTLQVPSPQVPSSMGRTGQEVATNLDDHLADLTNLVLG